MPRRRLAPTPSVEDLFDDSSNGFPAPARPATTVPQLPPGGFHYGSGYAADDDDSDLSGYAVDEGEPVVGRNILAPLARPWPGRVAGVGLFLGAVLIVLGFATGLGWGAPVLGHQLNWTLLGSGAGALLVGVGVLSRGWRFGGRAARAAAVSVSVLLVAAFGIGVVTNPVVVDGRVFLATSKEAKEYQLMVDIHKDLLRLRDLDAYLTYSPADAGAHYNEYAPALAELTEMSNKYSAYNESNLPDKRFDDTVSDVKSASYWAAKAMQEKILLLDEEDAKYSEDVATYRTNFAEQYVAAGRALSFLSADLNIPIDSREHE